MRLISITISLLIFTVNQGILSGQDNIPPDRPLLTYVTVDTLTNNTLIYWTESSSPDLEWYYLYYEVNTVNGPEGVKFDSVAPGITSYVHVIDASEEPMIYSISAIDTSGNESVRTPGFHSTIQADIHYDSCFDAIQLSWNKYTGWGNNLSGYRVYSRTLNGAYGNPVGVGKNDSTAIFNNIAQNTRYYFFVEAIKNDTLVSRSALANKYTYMPGPPDNFELTDVDVLSPGTVQINFNFTDTSDINDFRLMRSVSETADFIALETKTDLASGKNYFVDSIVTGSDHYYYRIGALNSCNKIINQTNYGKNIVLDGYNQNMENILNWNLYGDWDPGVEEYQVLGFNNDGSNFVIYNAGSGEDNYIHNLRDYFGTGFEGLLRYQVTAKKTGEELYSVSNILEVEVNTGITVPNAFTPNQDGRNDTFKPVFTLLPAKYLMVIYDRYGIIVFKTENPEEGWDGRINGGEMAIEGVYVYHIQYTSHNGTSYEKTGQLTLFYP